MLVPSRGADVATGKCRTCKEIYHRNYQVCTFADAAEEIIFCEIFGITKYYCSDVCLPRWKQLKVKRLIGQLPDQKEKVRRYREEAEYDEEI